VRQSDHPSPEPAKSRPSPQDALVAERLWGAFRQARKGQAARTVAQIEDALFQHYLPMARSIARLHDGGNPDDINQAAEIGLAQAILAWRLPDNTNFDKFAAETIVAQIDHRTTIRWGSGTS